MNKHILIKTLLCFTCFECLTDHYITQVFTNTLLKAPIYLKYTRVLCFIGIYFFIGIITNPFAVLMLSPGAKTLGVGPYLGLVLRHE